MIKIDNFEVMGWEHVIRGMRNPMNSWEKSDSEFFICNGICDGTCGDFDCLNGEIEYPRGIKIGPNDHKLMMKLAKGGSVHAKYRRMITVYVDITAPLYWWKEFDTYKVGTVVNSCSTMHKIHEKEFTIEDFSCEHLTNTNHKFLLDVIYTLNDNRKWFIATKEQIKNTADLDEKKRLEELAKKYWWQMIQLLPSSYNQKRTVMLNYEVLANMHKWRRNHKMDEGHWDVVCDWIESLPYSEIIVGGGE